MIFNKVENGVRRLGRRAFEFVTTPPLPERPDSSHLGIFRVLRGYGKLNGGLLPIDFLSRQVGSAGNEILSKLLALQEAGVVKIEGESVRLVDSDF